MTHVGTMQGITQEIRDARKARLQRGTEIKVETEGLRKEARNLVRGFTDSRENEGAVSRTGLRQSQSGRSSDVKNMMKRFHDSRKTGGKQTREEFAQSGAERKDKVSQLRSGASRRLKGFNKSRAGTAETLQKTLSQSTLGTHAAVTVIRTEAQQLLAKLHRSRKENANKLMKTLADSRSERASKVNEMRASIAASRARVTDDLKEVATAWRESAGGRNNRKNDVKTSRKVRTNNPTDGSHGNGADSLEVRLLDVVAASPGGTTLGEAAKQMGVFPVVLARTAKRLLDKGVLRKEDKIYSATHAEK